MANFVKSITSREVDFASWYSDIVLKAKLMEYSETKGFIMYLPYSYSIWENIQNYLNIEFKKGGRENVYFPLVIPESLFQKEKDHVKGFAPETAIISTTGIEDLSDRLIVRPTSEVLFCNYYKKAITSYKELPLKYNQWCSVVRWEKTTRPFLRGKEFLWQEGHTIHATANEARKEALDILKVYNKMGKNLLAIPFVTGRKTEKEKFAGAVDTYSIEALMHDGKALQSGTTHYFGQNFSKAFDITFTNKEGILEYAYQSSWGVSTRLLGAIIMVHGDDSGLILPPYIAPTQVRIIPIGTTIEVLNEAKKLKKKLEAKHIRVDIDNSDKTPGFRFSQAEMLGIPVRIEIGPKDLEQGVVTVVTRYNMEKVKQDPESFVNGAKALLKEIHNNMYKKAETHLNANIHTAYTKEEFEKYINAGGYVKLSCNISAEKIIKEEFQATARVILKEKVEQELCPITNKKATKVILFARAY